VVKNVDCCRRGSVRTGVIAAAWVRPEERQAMERVVRGGWQRAWMMERTRVALRAADGPEKN